MKNDAVRSDTAFETRNKATMKSMDKVKISVGASTFFACWESELSPNTCSAFKALLPFSQKIIHARWSGEACWIPLGTFDLGVPAENAISRPEPGQVLFYPAGISETEFLIPYGASRFCSSAGELAGNRILTITDDLDRLAILGKDILWNGSREIRFEEAKS
jgi:hypothetical protein